MAEQQYPEPTVGALILNPDGELLLVRSHKWHVRYTLPGGHVELGESLEEAVIREAKEETGLDVFDPEFLTYQQFIFDDSFYKERHFIFFDFLCRTEDRAVILNHEAEDYLWVRPEEALSLEVSPFLKKALRVYLDRQA
jgi:nucleoside triphosphatase